MSDRPDDPSGERPGPGEPTDPLSALFGGMGSGDLSTALHRMADLLANPAAGPVNWNLAKDGALQAAGANDPGTTAAESAEVAEAVRLADLWLDSATVLPSGVTAAEAWSRRRWVEATLPVWQQLCDPVARRVVDAMTSALPAEATAMAGPLMGVLRQVGGLLFGAQVGQAIASLAGEVVSSTDVALPLGPVGRAALLPANVAVFGGGLGIPAEEVRLYLALREAAHHRLFGHVPWLRAHLLATVEAYADGITVDASALESAVRELDPSDPEALQRALSGGLFEPETTPAQAGALTRLETIIALVEGWVEEVVTEAAVNPLPNAGRLRETVRRRGATGSPATATFATLVGLELRPRRLREAAALWAALREARGIDGRDAVWSHPDLMPTGDDLDDPAGFAGRANAPLDLAGLHDHPAPEGAPPGAGHPSAGGAHSTAADRDQAGAARDDTVPGGDRDGDEPAAAGGDVSPEDPSSGGGARPGEGDGKPPDSTASPDGPDGPDGAASSEG